MEQIVEHLNWHRLSRLVLNELLLNYKRILQGTAAIIIVAAFFVLLSSIDAPVAENGGLESMRYFQNAVAVFFFLLAGGALFTSIIFSDLHDSLEQYHYLLLPCSNLERFLSKYLLSGPALLLFTCVITVLVLSVGRLVEAQFVEMPADLQGVTDIPRAVIVVTLLSILTAHAALYFGAIFFRKYSLPKTVIASFVLSFSITLAFMLTLKIFFWEAFDGFFSLSTSRPLLNNTGEFLNTWLNDNLWVPIILWIGMYLWILFLAYSSLKEHEV